MLQILPEDAHQRVNGKLHISLTRVYDGKNVIVSQFTSKEDLLQVRKYHLFVEPIFYYTSKVICLILPLFQALLASCFVPVFSGMLPPRFRGIRYMDGGFSDNLPVLDENTITVSPFCGESDICPRDASSQLFHVSINFLWQKCWTLWVDKVDYIFIYRLMLPIPVLSSLGKIFTDLPRYCFPLNLK